MIWDIHKLSYRSHYNSSDAYKSAYWFIRELSAVTLLIKLATLVLWDIVLIFRENKADDSYEISSRLFSLKRYFGMLSDTVRNVVCYISECFLLWCLKNRHNFIDPLSLNKKSGPSCSKLTTSLVNDSLKFTSSDTQICWIFLLKKCE